MCWNENISLNTFLFSMAVILFIYYNNEYTQYKTIDFKNKYSYLLIISFVIMQLVEYFLWNSIKSNNAQMNHYMSIVGWFIIRILQPLAFLSMFPIDNTLVRSAIGFVYFLTLAYSKSRYKFGEFITTVKNGHLYWNWLYFDLPVIYAFYFLLAFALFFRAPVLTLFALISVVYFYIYKNNNWGSLWCWTINLVFIYYLFKILFIMPFKEYNGLC